MSAALTNTTLRGCTSRSRSFCTCNKYLLQSRSCTLLHVCFSGCTSSSRSCFTRDTYSSAHVCNSKFGRRRCQKALAGPVPRWGVVIIYRSDRGFRASLLCLYSAAHCFLPQAPSSPAALPQPALAPACTKSGERSRAQKIDSRCGACLRVLCRAEPRRLSTTVLSLCKGVHWKGCRSTLRWRRRCGCTRGTEAYLDARRPP